MENIEDINQKDSMQTGWSNEPTVRDLKQDYQDAKPDHDTHIAKVDKWLENLNVTGQAKPKLQAGYSNIQPKLIRKQAEWRYASLTEPFLSTDDVFNVGPVTYEDKQAAEQNALILNNQLNTKINKVRFFDEYIRACVDEGTAAIRTGWVFIEEEQDIEVPDFSYQPTNDPQAIQQHQMLHQMMQSNPEQYQSEVPPEMQQAHQIMMQTGTPVMPVQSGSHMEKQMVTIENHPTAEICNYNNLMVDPSCKGDMSKAGFAIYSFETNLSELEKEGKYTNLDQIDMESASILGEPDHDADEIDNSAFNFSDKPRKKFVAYEYWGFWDINDTGIVEPIVATWVGDVLIRLEENPFPDKEIPFILVQYLPVRRAIYGEPDGELLEDNQKIIGAVTRGMIDIMARSANGQQGSSKEALDITNKRKFDRGDDYEFNPNVDPRTAFHMHTFPEIPQSAEVMLNMQNADAESLTGVKAFSNGISGSALGDTATGIRSALDASSKRELGILRRIADGIHQLGRKFLSMNAVFLSEEEVVRITNDEFVEVRRDDLAGNFDITLSISTAEADDNKAQQLAFMLQTTGQTMGPMFSQMILKEIATLRKMPALAKEIKEYKPEPTPLETRKAELEVELLEAQVKNELSKAKENDANAELDLAKAANESSDKDLKNLDYVEQESGTKHARDVDKIESQSEAQTKMKIVEGAIKKELEAGKTKASA